jgi:hypothetical protein
MKASRITRPTRGKILVHGTGSGGITDADVERRARELAVIDGHNPAELTAGDFARARAELTGANLPPTTGDDAESEIALTRDPSEPPSNTGRQIPDHEGADEQKAVERLTEEGVEEAQHEQMLAARRSERRADRG